MTKELIDEMILKFVDGLIAHDQPHAYEQGEILRKGMYRTYGIKEEASDARN